MEVFINSRIRTHKQYNGVAVKTDVLFLHVYDQILSIDKHFCEDKKKKTLLFMFY